MTTLHFTLSTIDDQRSVATTTPDAFRAAMATVPTSVSVLTIRRGPGVWGMTIGSLTSLSLAPPRLLVCLRRDSDTLAALHQGFAVNVLAEGQTRVADHFAGRRTPSPRGEFADHDGVPFIHDAMTAFLCRVRAAHPHGDHVVVIADTVHIHRGTGLPMLRHDSAYRSIRIPSPQPETP